MENHFITIVDTASIVGCVLLAIVFLILPLPPKKSLTKYRISLRILSLAYLTMAVLKTVLVSFDHEMIDLFSFNSLVVASLQAVLFTFALIALINPLYIRKEKLLMHLLPVLGFVVLFVVISAIWGNPVACSYSVLNLHTLNPACLVRMLFCVFYLCQLIYLSVIFLRQTAIYDKGINDYFADSLPYKQQGVKKIFFAALTMGLFAFLSFFMVTDWFKMLFDIFHCIFYPVFGFYYVRYPARFLQLEPAIYPETSGAEKAGTMRKKLRWSELKVAIIESKYFLRPGVTIDDMAQYLKIGRTTLSTFINAEEGVNFNTWINFLRVEEAKILLLAYPDYNLTQIAEMIGYSEPSNFSRQFKLITNESPSVWRQLNLVETELPDYKLN